MFNLLKDRLNLSAVSRVVHRLPGRLRIHIRGLEKLSSRWHRYSAPVAELVKIKKGIKNTSIQPATGNVLITYDVDRLGEKDVFEWLESMAKIILNDIRDYTFLSDDNFESLLNGVKIQLMALEK